MVRAELKSIKVKERTYERVAAEAKGYGDTMDDIVTRLLDELDEHRRSIKSRK